MSTEKSTTSWWSELGHFGQTLHAGLAPKLTLAEPTAKGLAALAEAFPDFRAWLDLSSTKRDRDHTPALRWIDAVLEGFLGHSPQDYLKTNAIGEHWKVKAAGGLREFRPDRILRLAPPSEEHALPIFISFAPLNQKDGKRRALDLDRFLRDKQIPMGLITDGQSLRWVVTGAHQNAFTQWDLLTGWNSLEGRLAWQGLYTVLGRGQGWKATPDARRPHQLGCWLLQSGEMQGDLSTTLGEQIREAVEALVHALDHWSMDNPERLAPLVEVEPDPGRQNQALYTAAVRMVMRLVVIAFAESRDLLPTTFSAYRDSYGLEALWQRLKRAKGEAGFEHQGEAWMQLLALFRLVHDGSAHPNIALRAYGGDLFRPGDSASADPTSRAMALWEDADGVPVSDKVVLHILTLLKQTTVRVNGKAFATPVDFSTLSTEYIGLLYEGLLDYDLRTAAEPMLLLNLGQQPLLPLGLLQSKSEKELKELLETLAKEKATKSTGEEEESGEDEEDGEEGEDPEGEDADPLTALQDTTEEVVEEPEPDSELVEDPTSAELVAAAWAWAKEAVRIMPSRFGLGNLKRGQAKAQKPAEMDASDWDAKLLKAAKGLVARVIAPGDRYLIRWSGTRKGSGTFYTRPALTEPLIRETLRPLCFEVDGSPKAPEAILGLRVVDPAMGSASFLVGALRYLTEALYDSLVHHRFQKVENEHWVLTLPFGLPAVGSPGEDLPPVHQDDPDAEPKLKQRLKRHIVERCLYGVDLNSLAVELAKLAVWVETLDRNLPFGFLDHKLRCGNALVGCWLDRVDDYPVLAWDREGGDGKTGEETKALKEAFKTAKAGMAELLFRGSAWTLSPDHEPPQEVLPKAREALAAIHDLPVHEVDQHRERWQKLLSTPSVLALQAALDRWCALFFWPGLDSARQPLKPQALPMPGSWREAGFNTTVQELAAKHRFFHWELAFPEVFAGSDAGFDAVLGNPPWETVQPESLEFFTRFDPIYRTYGKQDALATQKGLFAQVPSIAQEWNGVLRDVRALTGFIKVSPNPYDASLGRGKEALADAWAARRSKRSRFSDPQHPYALQGSGKVYTYKLFLEVARAALRPGGRLGFVVPSGLYTDSGCTELRRTFLEKDGWELLYGFENKKEIFKIHRQFKFVLTVVTKLVPAPDAPLRAAFMRLETSELTDTSAHTLPVSTTEVRRYAPNTLSFMELRSQKDLGVARKLYQGHALLGDLGLSYSQEFNMTSDSGLWKDGTRRKLEAAGIVAEGEDTRDIRVRFRLWKAGWAPLVEGKHFWQFNPYYLGKNTEASHRRFLEAQKFLSKDTLKKVAEQQWETAKEKAEKNNEPFDLTVLDFMPWVRPRLVFRDVQNATNKRTFIITLAPAAPHGNGSPDLSIQALHDYCLAGILGSFCTDWLIRRKMTAHLNKFYIETLPIPVPGDQRLVEAIQTRTAPAFGVWGPPVEDRDARFKLRLELDALVAHAFDLPVDLFEHILLDPMAKPKGFEKIDKALPAAYRQPALTLEAYKQLLSKGLERFLQDGVEVPEDALSHPRPLIDMWAPEDGWATAWAEARAMADSQHEWDLFLGKEEAIQAEYGDGQTVASMVAEPEHTKPAYRAEPPAGALFDTEEFRQDGKRRLL